MNKELNTVIESIGVYLPSQEVSTEEILQGCKNPILFPFEKVTGIHSRRVSGPQEFSLDLSIKAVAECLNQSQYQPQDIDLLICCNISRYDDQHQLSFEPGTAIRVKHHFGFSNALVFDITNACAGMFTGIYIVDAFLKAGAIRRGMVVSGEYITHLARSAQREMDGVMDSRMACLTLGDAGAALILESTQELHVGFQDIELQTFGRYGKYCIAKNSDHGGMIMYTDSVNLTDVAVQYGARHSLEVLKRGGWGADSFQHLIMHQTSRTTLNSARNEINRLLNDEVCHDGNTINNLEKRGNTASTSHVVALADHIHNQNIQSGDKVVFSVSASGLTTGTALYVFDDLPDRLRQGGIPVNPKARSAEPAITSDNNHSLRVKISGIGLAPTTTTAQENTLEQLRRAANQCLQASNYSCNDIDLLIYSGVYRSDYVLEPAYAALLAGELGMNATGQEDEQQRTLAFDVFNGALGFLNACQVAQQMILAGKRQAAMVVAAETENNAMHFPDKKMGVQETASALILDAQASGTTGFGRFLFHYPDGMQESYRTYCDLTEVIPQLRIHKDSGLEDLYLSAIVPAVHELLQLEGLTPAQINWVFPPQISSAFIARLSDNLQLPLGQFINAVGEGADLFSSSIPYALHQAHQEHKIKPGDTGLIIAVGSGIQVGCALYHF